MEQVILTWRYVLPGCFLLLFLLWLLTKIRQYRRRKQRDFERSLGTLLLPEETVKAICKAPHGCWVLTSKRLIIQSGERFTAFPFGNIKKVSGVDKTGKAVVAAGKMACVTVKTTDDQVFTLSRRKGDFDSLVKGLKTGVSREKSKQKKQEKAPKETTKKETTKKETRKKPAGQGEGSRK